MRRLIALLASSALAVGTVALAAPAQAAENISGGGILPECVHAAVRRGLQRLTEQLHCVLHVHRIWYRQR